jgi:hypothetical protein
MPADYLDKLKAGFEFGLHYAGTSPTVLGFNTKIMDYPKSISQ